MEDIKNNKKNNMKLETRSSTRNHVFNLVFQVPFYSSYDFNNPEDANNLLISYYELLEQEEEFELKYDEDFTPFKINKEVVEVQYEGILENLADIDSIINENADGWEISRIDKADLAILRLAVYEIIFDDNIPNVVAIDEAVELAKDYSSEKSYKFINGVLAKVNN
ncbi:MAG: transcription antitermination factor NusB [bacterium]